MSSIDTQPDYAETHVAEALGVAERRLKRVSAGCGVGVWLVGTVSYVLLFVLFDHWLAGGVPTVVQRLAAGGYFTVAGIWLAMGLIRPALRQINRLYAARLVEKHNPELRNSLTSAVQLAEHDELPGSVRAAIVTRAAQDVSEVDPRRSVATGSVWAVFAVVAVVVAVLAAFSVVSPKATWPSVLRAFGLHRSAPTRVQLVEVSPADNFIVERGQPVTFSARTAGVTPGRVLVRFSGDGGQSWLDAQQLPLMPAVGVSDKNDWRAVKVGSDVQQPVHWQVVAGDARSQLRHLNVQPVISMVVEKVECEYPPYTQLPATSHAGGEIDAVIGTHVRIHAKANVEMHDPVLILGDFPNEKRRLIESSKGGDPHELTASLTVRESGCYRIEFRDESGRPNRNAVRYAIRARRDMPPALEVRTPEEIDLLATDQLPVVANAEDDFGLTRVTARFRAAGEDDISQEIDLPVTTVFGGGRAEIREGVELAAVQAEPGDVIEWQVAAWDNRRNLGNEPAYQQATTRWRRIVVRAPTELTEAEPESEEAEEQTLDEAEQAEGTDQAGGENDPLSDFAQANAEALNTIAKHLNELAAKDSASNAAQSEAKPPQASETGEPTETKSKCEKCGKASSAGHKCEQTGASSEGSKQGEKSSEGEGGSAGDSDGSDKQHGQDPSDDDTASKDAGEDSHAGEAEMEGESSDKQKEAEGLSACKGQSGGEQPGQSQNGNGAASKGSGQDGQSGDGEKQGESNGEQGEGQGQTASQGKGSDSGSPPGMQEGQGKNDAADAGDSDQAEGSQGQGQNEGEGDDEGDGEGEGEGAGEGEGEGEGQGEGEGKGKGEGEGEGEGTGSGQTSGQTGAGDTPGSGSGGGPSGSQLPSQATSEQDDPAPAPANVAEATEQITPTGQIDQLMEALDRALRRGEVDESLLDDLGWDLTRTRQFVEAYKRLESEGQPQPDRTELPSGVTEMQPSGESEREPVQRGHHAAAIGAEGLKTEYSREADTNLDVMEVGRQRVTPRYQGLLEAYYRSVGSQPAD